MADACSCPPHLGGPCRATSTLCPVHGLEVAADLLSQIERLTAEVERLEHLICHCWIHSGYPDCGYKQMERSLKALYCRVIQRTDGENYEPIESLTGWLAPKDDD